ncbi:MAG TPA: GAF and ANTAR domain-containing protein [Mycobacteriales bacterium]|nr:GAF and ANTAR domain-containing protein [Mycobacteriales bacterium]
MSVDRERGVTRAFVSVANSLAEGYDVVDLLNGLTGDCAELLDVASAGLLLADPLGVLHVVAASSERTRNLEILQLQRAQGPCLDCFRAGRLVRVPDLAAAERRWPQFVPPALEAGFASVHALPMRLRDTVLGTLGLFGSRVGALSDDDLSLGQALAHVASVALVQEKVAADKAVLAEQLQTALTSRVALEQAKGFLAQRGGLDMDDAFARLRRYARDHNERLTDVARAVTSRALDAQRVLEHRGAAGPPPTRTR